MLYNSDVLYIPQFIWLLSKTVAGTIDINRFRYYNPSKSEQGKAISQLMSIFKTTTI